MRNKPLDDHPRVTLYCAANFDERFLPKPADKGREWWEDDPKTRHHAEFCLPLLMANSLGYVIPSPATFEVSWDGEVNNAARIAVKEIAIHSQVDDHSAGGSFTVQPGFIPRTQRPGEFIYIKGIPNRRARYVCMEALIEAWWSPARFGLVFLVNRVDSFVIQMGEPLAQMFLYEAWAGSAEFTVARGYPAEHDQWEQRRYRPDYRRDLDYMRGRHPDDRREPTHVTSWQQLRLRPSSQ
jgi:hypothetical protein